jgi:hypothetical protein
VDKNIFATIVLRMYGTDHGHGFPFYMLRRVPYTTVCISLYVQEDVTKAAVFMVATQLAKEPLVR